MHGLRHWLARRRSNWTACRGLGICLGLAAACAGGTATRAELQQYRNARGELLSADTTTGVPWGRYIANRVTLTSTTGLTATGWLLHPTVSSLRHPAVLLQNGREENSGVVHRLPADFGDVVVLSLDYPQEIPYELGLGDALLHTKRMRQAGRKIPELFSLGSEYLARRADVDTTRIAIAATSFSVPFAVIAAAFDDRFRNVALVYGAGDLPAVVAANLTLRPRELRKPAARLAMSAFADLAPERFIGYIAPRPIVMVNGIDDPQMPVEAVQRLYDAARPPKVLVWLRTGHLMPTDSALIRALVDTAFSRLPVLSPSGILPGKSATHPTSPLGAALIVKQCFPASDATPVPFRDPCSDMLRGLHLAARSESVDVAQIAFTGTPKLATPPAIPTVSAALDRISKRRPELDGVARRSGTGRGVSIYVFDGGVYPRHPELAGRVRIGFDAYPSTPRVCNPHGTAVAGAAAGRNLGVAPDAEVIDVKIINCLTMHGSEEAVLAAARWVVADRREHGSGPAVANWSFVIGMTSDVPALDKAIGVLEEAGILVVVSAGNFDRDACKIAPGNSRLALVVGASSVQPAGPDAFADVRVTGTAWGSCVDVYAPGDDVLLPNYIEGQPTLGMWNGTSMSAGYVSGAAALVLEELPSARPMRVASIIRGRATADAVRMRRSDSTAGRGRLVYIGP